MLGNTKHGCHSQLFCILANTLPFNHTMLSLITSSSHDPPALEDANTEHKGKEQLVFLEERAADIVVDALGEVVVEVLNALLQVTGLLAVGDGLEVEVDEPGEGVLVHGLNVSQVRDTEEQDGGVSGHRLVAIAGGINLGLCGVCYLLLGRDLLR